MNVELALRTAIANFPTDPLPFFAYLDYLKETNAPADKISFYEEFTQAFINGKRYRHHEINLWYVISYEKKRWYVDKKLSYRLKYPTITEKTFDNIFSANWLQDDEQIEKLCNDGMWIKW